MVGISSKRTGFTLVELLVVIAIIGVLVLLGDSSVRWASNNLTLAAWRALSSPQGGETPGDF